MKEFWDCYIEGTDGGKYLKHTTLESARQEAERLARLKPGCKVYVLKMVDYCIAYERPIEWHNQYSTDNLPIQ